MPSPTAPSSATTKWTCRLTTAPSLAVATAATVAAVTTTPTAAATTAPTPSLVDQWADAAHAHDKNPHPVSTPSAATATATATTPTRVATWFERAREVSGLTREELAPHEWLSYAHECTTAAPEETFVAHTLVHHIAATQVLSAEDPRVSLAEGFRRLTTPSHLADSARVLGIGALGLSEDAVGFERVVATVYRDQHARFTRVKQQLARASAPKGSPLHALYATFSAEAQAHGVVGRLVRGAWRHLRPPDDDYADHVAVPLRPPSTRTHQATLTQHFQRKYDTAPDVQTVFGEDAVYICTVRHIDGHVLAMHRDSHRDVAVERACEAALEVVR